MTIEIWQVRRSDRSPVEWGIFDIHGKAARPIDTLHPFGSRAEAQLFAVYASDRPHSSWRLLRPSFEATLGEIRSDLRAGCDRIHVPAWWWNESEGRFLPEVASALKLNAGPWPDVDFTTATGTPYSVTLRGDSAILHYLEHREVAQ